MKKRTKLYFNFITLSTVLLMSFSMNLANAQDSIKRLKFGFELMYTPSYNFIQHTSGSIITDEVFNTIKSEENGRIVHPVVLNFTYDPIAKLRLKLGVGFQQFAYKTIIFKTQLENSDFQDVQFKNSSRYFQIPVSVQYVLAKSFYVEAAYVPLFLVNAKHTQVKTLGSQENKSISISKNGYYAFNQLVEFSVGYRANLGESSVSINVAPKISYGLNFAESNPAQIRRSHWQLGLSVGIHSFL